VLFLDRVLAFSVSTLVRASPFPKSGKRHLGLSVFGTVSYIEYKEKE